MEEFSIQQIVNTVVELKTLLQAAERRGHKVQTKFFNWKKEKRRFFFPLLAQVL